MQLISIAKSICRMYVPISTNAQSCIGELNKFAIPVCRCVRVSNNARGNYVPAYLITACLSAPIGDIIPRIKVPCMYGISRTK